MTKPDTNRLLHFACYMTIVALALFVWSVLDRRPLPIMVAMLVGQILGTTASALLGWEVISELRRKKVLGGDDE